MSGIPFRFNPRRHRRLLFLTRIRRIVLTAHIALLSFFVVVGVFWFISPGEPVWLILSAGLALVSGVYLRFVSTQLKKEHR